MSRREEFERQLTERIKEKCVEVENGVLVRGQLSRVLCRRCRLPRWNDGTRCPNVLEIDRQDGTGRKVGVICGERVGAYADVEEMA